MLVFMGCCIYFIFFSLMTPQLMQIQSFELIEKSFSDDNIVGIVSELCDTHDTPIKKARCVVGYYESHYNFVEHEGVRPATEFIEEGGVCRDFAVNVCATLENMNISCSYVVPPSNDHVFPIIEIGNGYCTYDNFKWMCNS